MNTRTLLIILAGFLPLSVLAQLAGVDYNWEEKRDKNGIRIYTSSVQGSPFKAVRGEMQVKGKLSSLVALVEDHSRCPDWAALCKESRVEKRVSPSESYAYVYNDLPWPVSDRDVHTHVVWSRNPDNGKVSMTSTASPGGPDKGKAVRLVNAVSQWHFTPNGDDTVTVENFAHIDPNGPTPAWITNMMLIDSPFDSMSNMRELIEAGEYADAVIEFLQEEQR